ncbi:Dna2/Cas4 domain-containing protein, partial [bacterium]
PELRKLVETTASEIHELLLSEVLPPPINNQRCPECSIKNICMPSVVAEKERSRKAALELFAIEGGK